MAERKQIEMLSALMGEQGQDALQMMRRMERLKRLMGTTNPAEQIHPLPKPQKENVFSCSSHENMISAAIPFLDQEYQKEIYVLVRLMEMRRVLQGGLLESREKAEEPPAVRRRKLLGAIQPHLSSQEQERLQYLCRIMDMKAIMEQEGIK